MFKSKFFICPVSAIIEPLHIVYFVLIGPQNINAAIGSDNVPEHYLIQ